MEAGGASAPKLGQAELICSSPFPDRYRLSRDRCGIPGPSPVVSWMLPVTEVVGDIPPLLIGIIPVTVTVG